MEYAAWRISFQSSEQAARAAYQQLTEKKLIAQQLADTVEHLTAIVRELEEENARLKRALKIANELLDLDGPMDAFDVIAELRQQLAAAQEEVERLRGAVRQQESLVWKEQATSLELQAQLATAEQRVAEACAELYIEDYDLTDIADRVRSGEYRKFMKGE